MGFCFVLKHVVSPHTFVVSSTWEHKRPYTFRTTLLCSSADKELKIGLKEAKHSIDERFTAIRGRTDLKSHFSASFSQTILVFCRQMEEAGWFKIALRQLNYPQSR